MKKYLFLLLAALCGCTKVNTLVYHSTAFDAKKAIETYEDYDVSVHYIIEENGNIIELVDEDTRAAHAGASFWRGYERINPRSVGIEVLQPTLGQTPYKKAQIKTVVDLSKRIIKKYKINPKMIVGHSDISPTRKPDPGKAFFWQELSENGVGLWYYLPDAKKVEETNVAVLLEGIGYDVSDISAAQYAFARRYMPELVATQNNMKRLLNNPYPKNFDASKNKKFVEILRAVYYRYSLPQCYDYKSCN